MASVEQILLELEEIASLLQKTQINLKKCPKVRLTKGYIEIRMQTVIDYWTKFTAAHYSLVKAIPKEKRNTLPYFVNDVFMSTEDLYTCLVAELKDMLSQSTLIKQTVSSDNNIPSAHNSSSVETQVKLPRIQLPTFSGMYEDWPAFHDLFTSLVHANESLSKVQKLHYLKTSTTGEAEVLIKHIQVTDSNFDQAWELLKGRYGNKRLIVNSILKKLFMQRKIHTQTASNIKSLLDTTTECINNLNNLNLSTDSWYPLIIFLVVQKLDPESHRAWEEYAYKDNLDELPKWDDLVQFLQTKFRTLELITPPSREKPRSMEYKHTVHVATAPTTHKLRSCVMCQENHTLCHCREFTKLEPTERCEYVKNNKLCFNCLARGHSAKSCHLNMSCRICQKRHHTMVHQYPSRTASNENQPDNIQASHHQVNDHISNEESNIQLSSHFATSTSTALLATALVPVRDEKGRVTVLRALIDQGSQATFISQRAAQQLRLNRVTVHGTITGVGSTKTVVKHATEIELLSRYDNSFTFKVKAYIMTTELTTKLPSQSLPIGTWSHIEGLVLADPDFNKSGRVDMLLGVEVCAQIMKSEVIKGPPGSPCAQRTSLGWILFGNIETESKKEFMVLHVNLDLNNMLKSMWELENYETKALTIEERKCEEIYQATHARTKDGRYIVKLPTKTNELLSTQGKTRDIALKRLHQLEKRLDKNPMLKKEYFTVMKEYKDMNHMEEVPKEEVSNPSVYLPHHAVVNENKETTKVRTVFNASQKGTNNISLNDELLVGPTLQTDMRSIIMKWRMKKVCFVADIQKMYRQILVKKEDRDLQRVLWRSDPSEPVKDYRLKTVTFGTACAPYLAVRTLHQVADDEGTAYPDAVSIIKEQFYVDDVMSGKDTLPDAINAAKSMEAILQKGGFPLQKWCSNSAEFLKQFEPTQRSSHVSLDITIDGIITALGLRWDMGQDVFQYNVSLPPITDSITKRTILADIQRLFDPLGWLGPAILPTKLLIQDLWLQRVTWDEEVNETIKETWLKLRDSFKLLNEIEVPRWVNTTECKKDEIEVHGFCDASNKAYAAVAYVRVKTENEDIKTTIIAARTRVAPVKPVSLPRLELCGAVLLSRLLKQIRTAMDLPEHQIFSWTDSSIVLSWLLGDPTRWNTFVRNRVVEILDNSNNNWYHVQTQDNPADTASRGEHTLKLKTDNKWWNGPDWLKEEHISFNRPNKLVTNLERKEIIQVNLNIKEDNEEKGLEQQFEDFESLTELLKTITFCKRFLKGKKLDNKNTAMTTRELEDSLKACIRIEQRKCFESEIKDLKTSKKIKETSKLKLLHPYLDDEHILRVGGRLRHSNLDEDSKHPIILDSTNNLAVLIVDDAHRKTLHGGVQLMLGYIRSKYWILKAKRLVKAKIHKCLLCAKHNAATRNQLMGDLPRVRVTPARAFLNSGVDFAGPYQILMSKGRGSKTNKAYVAIFICMATRAIHLELVGDLTSESFIGAFRRFVARRGKCTNIWSDQGRNFVGANKELTAAWAEAKLQFGDSVANSLALDGTQWHFIPAYSPHVGGLWEAGVKSMKHHMKRILTSHLTYEEMTTLLCQIEACLNSRPISPIDDTDTDHIVALTPGHFLIGEAPITVPQPDLHDVAIGNLSRWQHQQKLLADFWHRWQAEYLSRLQQRPKWLKKVVEFEIGHIVLIKTDNLPPGKWALGRIVAKHPGDDKVTRVYSVKSGDSVVKRSFNKLCPLPVNIES